uniref:DNA helicase n=1 Tax=Rhabditophanes sp. KR3021 TaxID=114890 RepID=A0AC35UAZ8_9BILA
MEPCQDIMMWNVPVQFPAHLTPYPSQSSIMQKCLFSFERKHNCLIESPTGSGKTMALLSAGVSWLNSYKIKRRQSKKECKVHGCSDQKKSSKVKGEQDESDFFEEDCTEEYDDDDSRTSITSGIPGKENSSYLASLLSNILASGPENNLKKMGSLKKEEVPCTCLGKVTIYYATRTHKQIAQVIKEYKRLPFGYGHDLKHTILGAREHSCINQEVKRDPKGVSAACTEINKKGSVTKCAFKENVMGTNGQFMDVRKRLRESYQMPIWDLEELVKFGEDTKSCPYYASSVQFAKDADIFFCPFSYLVDPIVRENGSANPKNAIIILDEAHNVEDVCRGSSSFEFSEKEIIHSLNDLFEKLKTLDYEIRKAKINSMGELNKQKEYLTGLLTFMKQFLEFFRVFGDEVDKSPEKFGSKGKTYLMKSIMPIFVKCGLSQYTTSLKVWAEFKSIWSNSINAQEEEGSEEGSKAGNSKKTSSTLENAKPFSLTIVCIEKFIFFAKYLMEDTESYRMHFSMEKSKTPYDLFHMDHQHTNRFANQSDFYGDSNSSSLMTTSLITESGDGIMNEINSIAGKEYIPIKSDYIVKMQLWNMDPATSFKDAFAEARSIILASGTLSPIDTFTSELGTPFKSIVQGDQVIPREQIFACAVQSGPSNRPIIATYSEMKSVIPGKPTVLAELGALILDVCQIVPKGVLVFTSSYNTMDSLFEEMSKVKTMSKIKALKLVLKEPRNGKELDQVMSDFKEAVADPKSVSRTCTGAIMFAVFRGKISEGIDFADDLARCVISVGIPFPNYTDEQVVEKKKYNTINKQAKNVLSGDDWYKIQAYRALNQALGRCLRHRNDWGLILLVDKRLADIQRQANHPDKYKISKWVVDNLATFGGYGPFKKGMSDFVQKRLEADAVNDGANH